ncbi:MAG: redox-regulated ATPase YchF [Deltaproteobacteria bacterium]|jgi:ribosome-binding ATPase|nr:redox-regulated ATPase YchF [Deltaproteobacteria bacterium]
MSLNCGIVGLPNVGKSTLFNAMTAAHVPAENYPFCTKDQNTGMVAVPDDRLENIAKIFKPERVVPTQVEFVDIAGLVEGAHKGEGLGNQFLGHIRNVDAIAHVVRCFDAPNVVHSYEQVDPIHDIEIVETELALADLEMVVKRFDKIAHAARTGCKDSKREFLLLEKIKNTLESGEPAIKAGLSELEWGELGDLVLLTNKPVIYILNVNETDVKQPSETVIRTIDYAKGKGIPAIELCGSIEAELGDLSAEERREFLDDLGLSELGLPRLIHATYTLLNLITFFTKDGPEARAWTVAAGSKAPQAAGKIHTDFERGFIRADVYSYDDLIKSGDEHKIREQGHLRTEGHDYVVNDGDVIHFKFNV